MAEVSAEKLKKKLEEIYAPLWRLGRFKAESDGEGRMLTGNQRTVLIVKDSNVKTVLKQILKNLEGTKMEGKCLFDIVWKGITNNGEKLWVKQLDSFYKGSTSDFSIKGFEVFRCTQSGLKAGVDIMVKKQ